MKRIRSGAGGTQQQPADRRADPALTPNAGLAAITELCGRLGVIGALDTAVGPVDERERGFGAGELLCGIAAAQLAGEDFLTGLDRQRADAAGQQLTPVPGLASTTAAGLARGSAPAQWQAVVEAGLAAVTGRMLGMLPAPRAAALTDGPVTSSTWTPLMWRSTAARSAAWPITTRASGSAGRMSRPGPRPRSCWPPTWATAPMTRARPRRICCAARWAACPRRPGPGGWAVRADAGYFAGQLAPRRPRGVHRLRDRRQADSAAVAGNYRRHRAEEDLARRHRDGRRPGRGR